MCMSWVLANLSEVLPPSKLSPMRTTAPAAEPHPPPEKRVLLSEFDKTEMSILMLDADSLTIVLEAVWSTGKVSSWSFVQVCRGWREFAQALLAEKRAAGPVKGIGCCPPWQPLLSDADEDRVQQWAAPCAIADETP